MKTIIQNITLIAFSITLISFFLKYVKEKYTRLSSISASAKHLRRDNKPRLFAIFIIMGIAVPLVLVGDSYLCTFAAAFIFMTGIITGYNPALRNQRAEDTLHVAFTLFAITLGMLAMIKFSLWYFVIIAPAIFYGAYLIFAKREDHTWKVEVLAIVVIEVCLVVEKIVVPLINLIK